MAVTDTYSVPTVMDALSLNGTLAVGGVTTLTGQLIPNGGIASLVELPEIVYVDSTAAGDADGSSWTNAYTGIKTALDAHRVSGNINYDADQWHIYFVRPGHYNEGEVLWSGYNHHIVGLGPGWPGKDHGVSINYDGAADATAAFLISGSGNSLHNVHIYCDFAAPALYLYNGDNNLIENVVIECDGTNATYGIYATSMKGSMIRNCVISNAKTAGIAVMGGADCYFINAGIYGCQIYSAVTGTKGIYVDASGNLVAYNAVIAHNFVDVYGGGATSKGIDIDHNGRIFVHDNSVVAAASAVGIEHAGLGCMANNVSVNGTMQGDSSHSFVDDGAKG